MRIPLVSVIMSVYNGERYLREAIESILHQTFDDFELVVIDDASTDSTQEILKGYLDSRIVLLTNPRNLGLTQSLSKAIQVTRGKIIARHDADDISYPDRFKQQVERLGEQPELGVLGTRYEMIDGRGRVLDNVRVPLIDAELRKALFDINPFCHGSVMIRRNYLEMVGGYRAQFPVTQDYDLWLRMSEHCQLANLGSTLYRFRFDEASISRKKAELQLAYHCLALELASQRRSTGNEQDFPMDVLTACPPEPNRLLAKYRWAAYLFYASNQLEQASDMLVKALAIDAEELTAALSWEDWVWSRGRNLARLRQDASQGAQFIAWALKQLEPGRTSRSAREILGRFYADQAFLASQDGMNGKVLDYFLEAIRWDRAWVRNRGLWRITFETFWQK